MIGVFDSGSGGLTVLAALRKRLPHHDFLYLGDHRHQPYGERGMAEVHALTKAGVSRLFAAGCRLVVLACNTAAAVALRRLQREWLPRAAPQRRVLGVHIPLVEALTGHDWRPPGESAAPVSPSARRRDAVVVFATPTTVQSHAFAREIARHDPAMAVIEQACPGLARAIETRVEEARILEIIAHAWEQAAAEAARQRWTVTRAALACTHYPLVEHLFQAVLPAEIRILDQPRLAAESLARYLARHPELDEGAGTGRLVLRTTAPAALRPALAAVEGTLLPWPEREAEGGPVVAELLGDG